MSATDRRVWTFGLSWSLRWYQAAMQDDATVATMALWVAVWAWQHRRKRKRKEQEVAMIPGVSESLHYHGLHATVSECLPCHGLHATGCACLAPLPVRTTLVRHDPSFTPDRHRAHNHYVRIGWRAIEALHPATHRYGQKTLPCNRERRWDELRKLHPL